MNYPTAILLVAASLSAPVFADEPPAIDVEPLAVELILEAAQEFLEERAAMVEAEGAEKLEQREGESSDADGEAQADAEPKELTEAQLLSKMRALEGELRDARRKFQEKANQKDNAVQEPARVEVDHIHLPENPTRQECEAYLTELREACEGRRSFSTSDPVVEKLKALPIEHLDLILSEIQSRSSLRIYANYALRGIEPDKLRASVTGTLRTKPDNIGVIVSYGWVQDVRPVVLEYVAQADDLTPAWFQAAVELGEPSLYPKLHEVTIRSRSAGIFIAMLEVLPDYDLDHTINTCWQRHREGKLSINTNTFADKAASLGNVDALGTLVSQLQTSTNFYRTASTHNARRTSVLRYIDFRGSNDDIQAWYEANKDKLVFDHYHKKFVLPEEF